MGWVMRMGYEDGFWGWVMKMGYWDVLLKTNYRNEL